MSIRHAKTHRWCVACLGPGVEPDERLMNLSNCGHYEKDVELDGTLRQEYDRERENELFRGVHLQ